MVGKANDTHAHQATLRLAKVAGGVRGIALALVDRQDDYVSDLGDALDVLADDIEQEVATLDGGD